ncbi:hypothetical protein [Pedococcus sp. 5OH_020]|uniref:hypothetical protein n=1 Tax=Pedococcus sp. 5OH_020 TaxID=2989814 RepID=UPI0022E9D9A3|nr:hypothetical protein [Pedococcus sp. 5OH_020]
MSEAHENVEEVLRLVEADYRSTTEFIARMINIETAARAVVIPLASALAGLAATSHSWELALAGIPIIVVGFLIDTRNSFIRDIAHGRSVKLERILQSRVSWSLEANGPLAGEAQERLLKNLDAFEFGMSRNLRNLRWPSTLRRSLTRLFTWLYAALLIILVVVAVGVMAEPKPTGESVCFKLPSGSVVGVTGTDLNLTGSAAIVACPVEARPR